jgi:hypothetical protein
VSYIVRYSAYAKVRVTYSALASQEEQLIYLEEEGFGKNTLAYNLTQFN